MRYFAVVGFDSENEFLFEPIPLLDSPTKLLFRICSLAFDALDENLLKRKKKCVVFVIFTQNKIDQCIFLESWGLVSYLPVQ